MRLDIGELEWTMPALIDTGSTHCLFPRGAGEALGLDFNRLEGTPYGRFRIAGQARKAIPAIVTMTLPPFEDMNWTAEVWFFTEEWDLPFGILGTSGFLDKWVVSFHARDGYFIVEAPLSFEVRLGRDPFEDFQRFYDDDWSRPGD